MHICDYHPAWLGIMIVACKAASPMHTISNAHTRTHAYPHTHTRARTSTIHAYAAPVYAMRRYAHCVHNIETPSIETLDAHNAALTRADEAFDTISN